MTDLQGSNPSQSDSIPSFRDSLLHRPREQRIVEFKYRFAQSVVFGLPVLGLHLFGGSLGGSPTEAHRWTAILQALLSGWVVYVAATGLLIEGLLLPRHFAFDLCVAIVAIVGYVWSICLTLYILFDGIARFEPVYHWVVVLLATWCGARWWQLARRHSNLSPRL